VSTSRLSPTTSTRPDGAAPADGQKTAGAAIAKASVAAAQIGPSFRIGGISTARTPRQSAESGRNRLAAIPRPPKAPAPCIALAASLALALSACGGEQGVGDSAKSPPPGTSRVVKSPRAGRPCPAPVGSFVEALDRLRRRLALGLSYEGYVEDVRQVRSAYDGIPADKLLIDCLVAVGTPGEKALDEYVGAANMWGECLSEAGCNSYSVEPRLQRRWRVASQYVSEAHHGIGETG
jgi:hypothetical protein